MEKSHPVLHTVKPILLTARNSADSLIHMFSTVPKSHKSSSRIQYKWVSAW